MPNIPRNGFTLIELAIALVIAGLLASITVPRASSFLDSIDVRGAANDGAALLASARHLAIARGERSMVSIDTSEGILILRVGPDTIRRQAEGSLRRVHIASNRPAVTYSAIGAGFGATNLTIIFTKGVAAETLTVSRLGRVRR